MSTIERKYNVESQVDAGKVCQLLNNGKVENLPLLKEKVNEPSNTINFGSQVNLDSAAMSTTSCYYFDIGADKILAVWTGGFSKCYAKMISKVDNTPIPDTKILIADEINGGGYYFSDVYAVRLTADKFCVMQKKVNSSTTYPLNVYYRFITVYIKDGKIYSMPPMTAGQIQIQSSGSLQGVELMALSSDKVVVLTHCYEGANSKHYWHYGLYLIRDEANLINSYILQQTDAIYTNGLDRRHNHMVRVNDNVFAVLYDGMNSVNCYLHTFKIVGTTITFIQKTLVANQTSLYLTERNIIPWKDNYFLVTFFDSTTDDLMYTWFYISQDGLTSIRQSNFNVLLTDGHITTSYFEVIKLTQNKLAIITMKQDYIIRLQLYDVDENALTATYQTTLTLTNGTPKYQYPHIVKMDSINVFVNYVNADSSPQYSCGLFGTFTIETAVSASKDDV